MSKGVYSYLTLRNLMARLEEECNKVGRTPPSRPTLYRLEDRKVWRATSVGANRWRKFSREDLEIAVEAILKDCLIEYKGK